ncbi:MAG: D-tyrosyl-tRNA(Tyr) deacylase [Denitrovibrio sp.]|nr:MAG: D-tyrosyl-tRNA(Tyr) deacylase [Denitrovibrio sp.]
MKVVLQRANHAYVDIEGKRVANIGTGLLILFGVEKGDEEKFCEDLAYKSTHLRIFEDDKGKMGKSVKDIDGEIIIVSQFTLAGNCKKGLRPDFSSAMQPDVANEYYKYFTKCCIDHLGEDKVQTGIFAADMKVGLENDGPVTIILEA